MNNSYNAENGKADIQQGCWKERSKMEKRLTIFSIIALLLIIALVILFIIFFTRPPSTCLSPSCLRATNEVLQHMKTNVDPCEDFYQFACGNFLENTALDGKSSRSVETLRSEAIDKRILGIIEEPESNNDPRSLTLSKRFYKSCTNLSAIEDQGYTLIKDSLRQIGGWPTLEGNNWKEHEFEWKSVIYKLRELGYNFDFFIAMHVQLDENDPTKQILLIREPYNPLYRATDEEEEQFFNFMLDSSVALGADRARAKNELTEVADFRKALFTNPKQDDNNDDVEKYDPLTVSELQYRYRDVPWLEYINRLMFPAPNISYDQIIGVYNGDYFLRLQNLLRRTPKRVVANYIAWRMVREHVGYLTTEMWEIIRKYNPSNELPTRSKLCSNLVHHLYSLPVQAAYVRKYFPSEAKIHVNQLLQTLKDEFREVLTNLNWIDEETRIKALERLATSNNYVAFPNDLMDNEKIEARYMGYQIDEDNFLASILNSNYYATNLMFQQLHEPAGKDAELDQDYTTYTRSYYSSKENTITIPVGFLQGVIYDDERPQYLNYGSLGSSAAHQVFHTAFESQGCQKETKYYEWISTPSLFNFNEKLSCIAMHYGKYSVPEIGEYLNSSNTKYEDIADLAGVKLAYSAYKKWVSNNGPEQSLPGLDYTPQQLFWISSATRFCKKITPDALKGDIGRSHKSPDKFRALGVLRNSEEFSRDFNCPTHSYMNANDKCEIW